MESLYNYYETKEIRPTYAAFDDKGQLDRYSNQRKNYFYRLNIPYTFFKGKTLLEFGPDTGENALVFAQWGASLTLVEPIPDAHLYIKNYFAKYELQDSLKDLIAVSLLDFTPESKFDVIDAEGFIYTIQPSTAWIKKAKECLQPDGLFIISFIDFYGGFFEILLKAIYHSVKQHGNSGEGVELAKHIFLNKWNSINHTRSIESWFMDVIENPFVRLKYFIDPIDLLKDIHAEEMRLFSSWPTYRDPHSVDWIKKPFTAEQEMNASIGFIKKSRLSHFLGTKCFIPVAEDGYLDSKLKGIVQSTDKLIDEAGSINECTKVIALLEEVKSFMASHTILTNDGDNGYINSLIDMITHVFTLMEKKDAEGLVKFCQTDPVFISTWGVPTNNVVFQNS